ncbi:MAG TPA: tripartite tricarboxylate transporter TctB family protein [Alphaproteobacteria bacterium]|nr:tripartite tricarboxylate transporter TctB family protein [Alphaproteobacteria bacterium]
MRSPQNGTDDEPGPLFDPADTGIAAVIIAVSAGLFYVTSTFDQVAKGLSQNIGPEYFPQIVLVTIVLLALVLPFECRLSGRTRARLAGERRGRIELRTWLTAALLVLIVSLIEIAGTLITLALVCALLPPLWGNRRLRVVLPFALVFPAAIKLLFENVLKVRFEPGLLIPLLG